MALILRYTADASQITCDPRMGEMRLLAEIINRAVSDLVREGTQDYYTRDAADWINTRSNCPKEFSFEWCCELLGVDPETIRAGLQKIGALQGE